MLTEVRPDSDRSQPDRQMAYEIMHDRAAQALRGQTSVILDSTYSRQAYRKDLLNKLGGHQIYGVELHLNPELARERFEQRHGHPGVNMTAELTEKEAAGYPWSIFSNVLRIDAGAGAQRQARTAARWLLDQSQNLNASARTRNIWIAEGSHPEAHLTRAAIEPTGLSLTL